jgi:ectoine hydroxylase-related dioxygenase (phytanoyl-CoA dioxygenase family)
MSFQLNLDQFLRDGFMVVRNVFTLDEVKRFLAAVDAAIGQREDKPPSMGERDDYDRMFTQYYNLWESSPEVRALTFHPKLAQIASALLQVPALRVYSDQSFYKEPGSTETGVHQDYRLLSIEETQTLNAWIPLEGCTRDAGGLAYLPGSHKFGRVTNVDILLGLDTPEEVQQLLGDPVFVELAPGDVVFHHVLTYHLASSNQSNRTRKAMAITYFADGSTRGTAWPHASVDRAGIAVGQRIQGPATPLVWPPQAALPQAPPPNPNPPRGWPGYRSQAVDMNQTGAGF